MSLKSVTGSKKRTVIAMSDTTIKVSRKTHKRLYAEKLMRDARTIDDAICQVIREADKKRKKKDIYGMLSV